MPSDITWTEADLQASSMLTWESVYPDASAGKRSSRHVKVVCPFIDHADTDASCALYESGQFHCYGCGQHGGMARFLVLAGLISDWGDALKHVQSLAGITSGAEMEYRYVPPMPSKKSYSPPDRDFRAEGLKLWDSAKADFSHSVGHKYLRYRCPVPMNAKILGFVPDGFTNTQILRYLPGTSSLTPAYVKESYKDVGGLGGILIARYSYPRMAEAFEVEGITKEGKTAPKDVRWRRTWGSRPEGSACHVWDFYGDVLVVCEGVLSALSAPWCLKKDRDCSVHDIVSDIGGVVAVGGKENFAKFARKLDVWLEKTDTSSLIVCAEAGDEESAQKFKSVVEKEFDVVCFVHEHDVSEKGWDCCDEMSYVETEPKPRPEPEPEPEPKVVAEKPRNFEYRLEVIGDDAESEILLISELPKEHQDFGILYQNSLPKRQKELKYAKDTNDICYFKYVAYLDSGKLSDFASLICDWWNDESMGISFVVCLPVDKNEFKKLQQVCLSKGIVVTDATPNVYEPEAEIVVLDDRRPSAEKGVVESVVEKSDENWLDANER